MPIRVTRRLLTAALDGSLNNVRFRIDPHFGLSVPIEAPGVETHILNPIRTWRDKGDFLAAAEKLVEMFHRNFRRFEAYTDEDVRNAGPASKIALV